MPSEVQASLRTLLPLTVIDLRGEVTTFAEEVVTGAYRQASELGARHILLNFDKVDYINSAGIATIMLGCLASLLLTMALAKRVDHAWKLVRRAAGHRQDRGALERIFAGSVGIALVVFAIWFLVIQGPGPSLAPGT